MHHRCPPYRSRKNISGLEGQKSTLVSNFDLKGAFNGVATDVLLSCLRAHRIPEEYVQWIQNFCTERSATITVNGLTSALKTLENAGFPQGSLLSLYYFHFSTPTLSKA